MKKVYRFEDLGKYFKEDFFLPFFFPRSHHPVNKPLEAIHFELVREVK